MYSGTHSISALRTYAEDAKAEGLPTLIMLVLMVIGWFVTDRDAAIATLFGLVTVDMLIAPVALLFYGARYATPTYGPLACSAAIGLDAVIRITVRRRSTRQASEHAPPQLSATRSR